VKTRRRLAAGMADERRRRPSGGVTATMASGDGVTRISVSKRWQRRMLALAWRNAKKAKAALLIDSTWPASAGKAYHVIRRSVAEKNNRRRKQHRRKAWRWRRCGSMRSAWRIISWHGSQ